MWTIRYAVESALARSIRSLFAGTNQHQNVRGARTHAPTSG
jgi:hypothetical protein